MYVLRNGPWLFKYFKKEGEIQKFLIFTEYLGAPWTKINCVTWNIMMMGMPKLSVGQV